MSTANPAPSPRHVLIAGGGIGGLTLACALRRAGLRATVFERAELLRPVGAGITVQMNAMAALRTLGLADEVAATGATFNAGDMRQSSGKVLTHFTFDALQREFGVPVIGIHRARLQAVLLAHAGEEHVHMGRAVTAFHDDGQRVMVELSDGSTATGDVLVGADGLHSVVRRAVLGDTPLRYSGYTSCRGVTRALSLVENPGHNWETWGAGARFGIVHIGHGEIYWFCTWNTPAGGKNEPGRAQARLLEIFGDWHAPIPGLIQSTPEENIIRTDINDRVPVERWSQGRVTLLGDAAHPMTPNMGQGGCQAIEDAVVLAGCLAREAEVPAALAAYEQRRIKRANGFVSQSFQLGRVGQLENVAGRFVRDTLTRLVPASLTARQVRAVMDFTP
jgi:2-polyprenyl-6-methoxyphenol hydroxylase-like FAD-dependent oxidoreductase